MRIAYCGYDFFHSSLGRLLKDGHELVELFTWPTDNEYDFNDRVLAYAQEANAKVTLSAIDEDDMQRLAGKSIDAIVCAAYPFKLPDWTNYVRYAINVHPSLLPIGRGPWPLPWTILKGLSESGITIHEVSGGWDDGAILAQESFPVRDYETLESLSVRSQMAAEQLLSRVLADIKAIWASRKPQSGEASYWKMPQKEDRTIKWEMGVDEIDRLVRAFSKFEPFLYIENVRFFVRKVDCWKEDHQFRIGDLVHETNREKVFAASDGFVCLTHFERADEV